MPQNACCIGLPVIRFQLNQETFLISSRKRCRKPLFCNCKNDKPQGLYIFYVLFSLHSLNTNKTISFKTDKPSLMLSYLHKSIHLVLKMQTPQEHSKREHYLTLTDFREKVSSFTEWLILKTFKGWKVGINYSYFQGRFGRKSKQERCPR